MEESIKNIPNDKGSKSSLFSFLNGLVPSNKTSESKGIAEDSKINRYADSIEQSNYLSRDLSWLKFNERVLDQTREKDLNLFERLKFLAITASNLDAQSLAHCLGAFCPNILFPYARETIASLVSRGSFPQLNLAPVNFDALFASHIAQLEAEQAPVGAVQ